VLSAQLMTAPTGKPRDIRNLAPAEPPRPEKSTLFHYVFVHNLVRADGRDGGQTRVQSAIDKRQTNGRASTRPAVRHTYAHVFSDSVAEKQIIVVNI